MPEFTDYTVADIALAGWGRRDALEEIDLDGAAVTAGLVDAHMHMESTKLWVDEFVRPQRATGRIASPSASTAIA